MKSRTNTLRLTLAALIIGTGLCAQESPWSGGLRFGGGFHQGSMKESLNASQHFGFGVEVAYKLNPTGALVADMGVRWYPGKQIAVSLIPKSVSATNVNPTVYEARLRKPEARGIDANLRYRFFMSDDIYLQGGLRIARNYAKDTDIGSRITTDGTAISNMGDPKNVHILRVDTIADQTKAYATSLGLTMGAGYRINQTLAFETNFFTTQIKAPTSGDRKNAVAVDFALNVRF